MVVEFTLDNTPHPQVGVVNASDMVPVRCGGESLLVVMNLADVKSFRVIVNT